MLLRELNLVRTNVPAVEQLQRIRAIELAIAIDEPFRRHLHRFINIKAYWTKNLSSCVCHACRKYRQVKTSHRLPGSEESKTPAPNEMLFQPELMYSYSNYSHSGETKPECVIKDDP